MEQMTSNHISTKNGHPSSDKALNASARKFKPQGYSTKSSSKCKVMETIQEPIASEDTTTEVCLTLKEIKLLKIGDLVDFRDYYGLLCTASITDCDHNSNRIKIHYNNWGSTYDEWWHYLSSSSSSETTSNSRSILNPTRSNNNDNEDEEDLASDNDENNEENDDNSEIITLSQSDKNHRIARYGSIISRGIKRQCLKYQAEELQKNVVAPPDPSLPNNTSSKNNNSISSPWQRRKSSPIRTSIFNEIFSLPRYDPNLVYQYMQYANLPEKLSGCVSVSKKFTKNIIPQLIAEELHDIYNYMDMAMAFTNNKLPLNHGNNVIINFNIHEKKSNEPLFCILEKQKSEQREWRMLSQLFTAKMIEFQYNISRDKLPDAHAPFSIGKAHELTASEIKYALLTTKWSKIKVYNRKNNKQRQVLHITNNEFKKMLEQKIEHLKYQQTIPIFGEDGDLEHVMIIDLTEQVSIGISYKIYDLDEIEITGIYLDKEEILLRHQVYNPKHKSHCLDHFKLNIDDLKIGNIYDQQNKIKNLRLHNKELRKEYKNPINKYIKQVLNGVNDLISNDMGAALSAIKHIFNVETIKNAINSCRKSKQRPQSSTITTNITSNSSNIPTSYLTTICGSYATTTPLPPLNAALRSIPQQ